MSDIENVELSREVIHASEEQYNEKDEPANVSNGSKPDASNTEDSCLVKKDEFLSPSILPPVAKTQKKQNSKPVSLTIKSRFAIPADIYKAPKVAAFISPMPRQKKEKDSEEPSVIDSETSSEKPQEAKPKESKPKAPPAKLTYQSPNWSVEPDDGKYSLEVLKNGSIVGNVKLSGKDRFLIGRLPDCDIKMEHPSISRYHAVLQHGAPDSNTEDVELQKDGTSGFYVYDLGSTHGTIINKQQVRSKLFYRIKVGHVVKFGGSTRMFILQGPDEDQEEEAKESATELRELNSERRSGHWHVKLCLPVDDPSGKPVYAEVNATGKKKDTIRQCAMEACRILEKHGMFHHKERQRQKVKQWEDDDFYDSGEDEFHDRTGELEMKRKMRMQRVGKKSGGSKTVETYESLHKKVTELDNEIKDIEEKLEKDKAVTKVSADAVDPLDAFMQQVKSGKALDTTTRSKLKRRLLEARKEHMRVAKLADLARPSSLPPLQSSSLKNYSFVGKMKGRKKPLSTISTSIATEDKLEIKDVSQNDEEEFDDGEHDTAADKHVKTIKLLDKISERDIANSATDQSASPNELVKSASISDESKPADNAESSQMDVDLTVETAKSENNHTSKSNNTEIRVLGPTVPDELRRRLSSETDISEQNPPDEEAPEPKRRRRRQRNRVGTLKKLDPKAEQFSDDPKYSGWMPPENQSGDGKTSLNEKLGY